MEAVPFWIILAFFTIALFYSMVGFGGGSSYLAVLVLAAFPYLVIPAQALVCNTIVAGGGSWHFWRSGHFRLKKILPFVVSSIPMAYWGGRILLQKEVFCFLLGVSLLMVSARLRIPERAVDVDRESDWKTAWLIGLPLGGVLGFLAGLVGIGGGIFLSPILLLIRWANPKEAAASAAIFILVNSLAGLGGHLQKGFVDLTGLLPLALAVLIGGQMGSRLGAYRLSKGVMQKGLSGLVLYVSVKLMIEAI